MGGKTTWQSERGLLKFLRLVYALSVPELQFSHSIECSFHFTNMKWTLSLHGSGSRLPQATCRMIITGLPLLCFHIPSRGTAWERVLDQCCKGPLNTISSVNLKHINASVISQHAAGGRSVSLWGHRCVISQKNLFPRHFSVSSMSQDHKTHKQMHTQQE